MFLFWFVFAIAHWTRSLCVSLSSLIFHISISLYFLVAIFFYGGEHGYRALLSTLFSFLFRVAVICCLGSFNFFESIQFFISISVAAFLALVFWSLLCSIFYLLTFFLALHFSRLRSKFISLFRFDAQYFKQKKMDIKRNLWAHKTMQRWYCFNQCYVCVCVHERMWTGNKRVKLLTKLKITIIHLKWKKIKAIYKMEWAIRGTRTTSSCSLLRLITWILKNKKQNKICSIL